VRIGGEWEGKDSSLCGWKGEDNGISEARVLLLGMGS